MISGIGSTGSQRTMDMLRTGGAKPSSAVATPAGASEEAAPTRTSPAALLAAEGAPIDSDKVSSVKAAIANGTYAINPRAIADRMIALDMPGR